MLKSLALALAAVALVALAPIAWADEAAAPPAKQCVLHSADPDEAPLMSVDAGPDDAPIAQEFAERIAGVSFTARGCLAMLKPIEAGANPISVSGGPRVITLGPLAKPFASVSCTCF